MIQVEFPVSTGDNVAPVLMVPILVPSEAEESGMTSGLVVALGDLEVFFIVLPRPYAHGVIPSDESLCPEDYTNRSCPAS